MDLAVGADEIVGIELFRNEGDGTFSPGPIIPIAFDTSSPYWVTAGDLDLDGNTDLVVTNNVSQIAVIFLDGAGNSIQTQMIPVSNPVEAVIEDFNNDGLPDIAIAGNYNGFGAASGAFVLPQVKARMLGRPILLPASGTQGVAATDLNLDGTMDLIAISDIELKMRPYYGVPSATCPADLTGDGELNFFDVSQLLTEQVDYNGDGLFNFFDVSAFLIDFKAGCP
tara:strand:- start:166 stop:840 length:675 start_codon:yes stop_codon:yes gene_type:complete